jgi:hypothetical protein
MPTTLYVVIFYHPANILQSIANIQQLNQIAIVNICFEAAIERLAFYKPLLTFYE